MESKETSDKTSHTPGCDLGEVFGAVDAYTKPLEPTEKIIILATPSPESVGQSWVWEGESAEVRWV